ncbi:MAG: IS5 family transposase [Candidatus Pacearchaeota archaeon]|nr:IS5 family transposase [Candidatus Pacearchaeota archaeon]
MVNEKRWGKKYVDNRNWQEYTEKLVMRGYFYFNPEFLNKWNEELKQMNARKIGQPYLYPESMIKFLAVLHCKFDFRALEGFMRWLSEINKFNFPVIDYSQICRRYNALEIDFKILKEDMKDYLLVGVDGSGEKSTKRGGWMREKWKTKKGWIKVVILGTPDGKIIDIRIGTETLDERASVRGMIRNNHKKIKKVILDGWHDCRKTFDLCEQYNIETAIKIRKNAQTKAKGSPRRRKEVLFYKSMTHKEWVKKKEYGLRWPASEGIFSRQKTIFGEYVSAKKKINMYHEVKLKFWAVNKLNEIT